MLRFSDSNSASAASIPAMVVEIYLIENYGENGLACIRWGRALGGGIR